MDVDLKFLSGFAAGLCLLTAGTAGAVPADVLTVSAGTAYTGGPLEATIQEADEGTPQTVTLTLSLSSPLAQLPPDLVLFENLLPGSGVHRIHLAPGAGADTVELEFSWAPDDLATKATKAICLTTVGFGLSCLDETGSLTPTPGPSQDLTDLLFPPGGEPFHVMLQTDPEPVPEPGALLLTSWGFAGFLAVRRRRH
ncbi:MAG TPA: hypothetical protein DEP35_25065 [Deltaproteobacteria bacterium]|jgi:hypothetical protein|nr:hypothetical protein [Deltaproteobacteria bacterium]